MINFIVVDDIEFFREKIKNTILHFSFNCNVEIRNYMFDEYNYDFRKITNKKIENKVYILDIETKKHNGIEEAIKIRKKDSKSIIIFLTMYENAYCSDLLRSNLNFMFISKDENIGFNNALYRYLKKIYNDKFKKLKLNVNEKILCNIPVNDILYINSQNGKTNIVMESSKIQIYKSLTLLIKILPNNFMQIHRSCIVNIKNVVFIGKKIILINGEELFKISKYKKKALIESYKNIHNISGD